MNVRNQYAALPYQVQANDEWQVLLVTSRRRGRWIIPKGWPIKNRKPHRAAAVEAFEEAGVIGTVEKRPIGAYGYEKRLVKGSTVPCCVTVFPLTVETILGNWPEAGERKRRWCEPQEAADLVDEPGLARILRSFGLLPR